MTGTGEVLKRRIREGSGEFPIDCPLEDNAVRVHYKAFRLDNAQVYCRIIFRHAVQQLAHFPWIHFLYLT